jgi:hypothetical protein
MLRLGHQYNHLDKPTVEVLASSQSLAQDQ